MFFSGHHWNKLKLLWLQAATLYEAAGNLYRWCVCFPLFCCQTRILILDNDVKPHIMFRGHSFSIQDWKLLFFTMSVCGNYSIILMEIVKWCTHITWPILSICPVGKRGQIPRCYKAQYKPSLSQLYCILFHGLSAICSSLCGIFIVCSSNAFYFANSTESTCFMDSKLGK